MDQFIRASNCQSVPNVVAYTKEMGRCRRKSDKNRDRSLEVRHRDVSLQKCEDICTELGSDCVAYGFRPRGNGRSICYTYKKDPSSDYAGDGERYYETGCHIKGLAPAGTATTFGDQTNTQVKFIS